MATTIADNTGNITFIVDGNTYDVSKSDIIGMNLDRNKGRVDIYVSAGIISGNYIYIHHSEITAPDDKCLGAMYITLKNWWKEPGKRSADFIADVDQTEFDVSPRITLTDSSYVIVDQQLQTYGFTRVGNLITFDDAMFGNEEIVVFK